MSTNGSAVEHENAAVSSVITPFHDVSDNSDDAHDYCSTEASDGKGSKTTAATEVQCDASVEPSTSGESNGEEDSVKSSNGKKDKGKAIENEASKGKEAAVPSVVITPSPGEKETPNDLDEMSLEHLWKELDEITLVPAISMNTNTRAALKEGKDFEARSLSELKVEADEVMETHPGPDEGIPSCFKRVHTESEDMPLAKLKVEAKKFLNLNQDLHLSIDQIMASSTPLPDEDGTVAPKAQPGPRATLDKAIEKMTEPEIEEFLQKGLRDLLVAKPGHSDKEGAGPSSSNPKKQQDHDPKMVTDIPGLNITEFMLQDHVYDRPRRAATAIPTFDTPHDRRTEDMIRDYIHAWNSLAAVYDRQYLVVRYLLLLPVVKTLSGAWHVLLWRIGAGPAPVPLKVRWTAQTVKWMVSVPWDMFCTLWRA
ncbi:hypothetical protein PG993_002519 [Apiospora rasikravindrae]|uniref:Uncharacterized protein n=1 Tax=Apiospora rasikravindrae TaxID=990691 RepID=A0ABR1TWV9_9PEZI